MATDLYNVIEESVQEALDIPPDAPETETPESTPTEPVEASPEAANAVPEPVTEPVEIASPAAKPEAKPVDDFDKKYGVTALNAQGRENRIPHTRVKTMVTKAEKEGYEKGKAEFVPKVTEYETKVKDYETRLARVAATEKFILEQPIKFLERLATIPAYQEIFSQMAAPAQGTQVQQPAQVTDDMPQPDQKLSDGSMVYSLDGLRALNAWNREQARKETLAEVDKRFGPIAEQYEAYQKTQAIIPQVQKQIDEARKWPQFNENEAAITAALAADQKLSLEGAYQKVVFPKLTADRNKMREELLAELKQAPRSTSTASRVSKPVSSSDSSPRDLESIIREAANSIK